MKIITGLSIFSLAIILIACSGKLSSSKVPESVKKTFASQYPGIDPKWDKENGNYEASFDKQGLEMSAVFDEGGKLLESEVEMPIATSRQL